MKRKSKNKDIIALCKEKYFKLTGTSPEYSFWMFVTTCDIEPTLRGFEKFYNEMDQYFE